MITPCPLVGTSRVDFKSPQTKLPSRWKVVAKKLVVRRKKQLTSKRLRSLKKNDTIIVKALYNNNALIMEPCQGWINVRSGSGEPLIRQTRSPRKEPRPSQEQDLQDGSASQSSSSSWEAFDSSPSASRSTSNTRSVSRDRTGLRTVKKKCLVPPKELRELVKVEGYYGMITSASQNINTGENFYETLLDSQSETVLLKREEIQFLTYRPEVLFKSDKLTHRKYVKQNTRHNRDSTRVPFVLRRFRRPVQKRVHWSSELKVAMVPLDDSEDGTDAPFAEPNFTEVTSEDLLEIQNCLQNMNTTTLVHLLSEMTKQNLFTLTSRSLKEEDILALRHNILFQKGFYILSHRFSS